MKFADGLPAEMRSSMQNDLAAGNRLEAPWLCGAVARMARGGRPRGAGQRDALRRVEALLQRSGSLILAARLGDPLMRLLLVWLINALALLALPYVFPWVKVDSFGTALIAALVLGTRSTR